MEKLVTVIGLTSSGKSSLGIELAKKFSDKFVVIDASGEKEETHQKIINALKEKGIF